MTASPIAIEGAFGALRYAELQERVVRRAKALVGEGVRPGERVLVRARVDLPTLETMLATLRLGAVLVPIADGATPPDVEHVVSTVRPRLRFDERAPLPDAPFAARTALPDPPASAAPALVIFTSGTTGKPKGAVISHGAIDVCNRSLADAWGWSAADVLSLSLPLFHVHGLCLGLLGSLALGARIVIEPRFAVERVIEHFTRAGDRDAPAGQAHATALFSVPTMLHRLVEHAQRDPSGARFLSSGRLFVSGSAPLPLRDLEQFHSLTGHRVVERYGMTETLMNTTNRWSSDDGYRAGSVGRALPGVTLSVEDDDGRALSSGEMGEVTLTSPSLFDGYVVSNDHGWQVARGDAMRGDRFATGDVGRLDEDGFLWLLGRKSTDVLKSCGFKVGAGEVEAALLEHPGVAECAVVGIADPELGERIVAFVVPRVGPAHETLGAEALLSHARDQLVHYKRPRAVILRDALPRNAMGKVQKKILVAELERDAR